MARCHRERHRTGRIGWLRAAVLGANDGIVSTASLVLGVAAAQATHSNVVVSGVAGLVAGAMSMAAGEYVSVYSQMDIEQAELARVARQTLALTEAGLAGIGRITLTKAGKVLIEGSYVLSRSTGVNRIKGGSVQLN